MNRPLGVGRVVQYMHLVSHSSRLCWISSMFAAGAREVYCTFWGRSVGRLDDGWESASFLLHEIFGEGTEKKLKRCEADVWIQCEKCWIYNATLLNTCRRRGCWGVKVILRPFLRHVYIAENSITGSRLCGVVHTESRRLMGEAREKFVYIQASKKCKNPDAFSFSLSFSCCHYNTILSFLLTAIFLTAG